MTAALPEVWLFQFRHEVCDALLPTALSAPVPRSTSVFGAGTAGTLWRVMLKFAVLILADETAREAEKALLDIGPEFRETN